MNPNNKIWTENDIFFLTQFYSDFGCKYCATKLNRTKGATFAKARKIGLQNKRLKIKYHENNFRNIVNKSTSLTDVIRNLGMSTQGKNHNTVKKYINIYNIDTSHFISQSERIKQMISQFKKKPLSEILVENNFKASGKDIKNRLFKEKLKINCCELCGQGEIWYGKKISLILDHKNGIHSDWRLENLRIVCPNCNATLETHCRGNKKMKK